MTTHPGKRLVLFSVDHPRTVIVTMLLVTVVLAALAAVPNFWAPAAAVLPRVKIDTDPENMLRHDEPHRLFHDRMKKTFTLWDMVVVGVVNDKDPQGVFNPRSLGHIAELTDYARSLRWPDPADPSQWVGVVEPDVIAPSTVDNIEQGAQGEVVFSWLMRHPPTTDQQAAAIRDTAQNIPFLNGTLVSEDGRAVALYLPLTSKDVSYQVRQKLLAKIASFGPSDDRFHITGLPVAEDTFGVEMFYQMALSAPLAMAVIFLLMWWFFKKLSLIIPPMILAMVSAISTMAVLVLTGQTIHIMSSMIPIFIMPIAVLDAIHIISDFFDRYAHLRDRRRTVLEVMDTLFVPMLFTSLTTTAGFISLALTPIPPVQVFGLFVGLGVMLAWVWTITFIPAAAMLIPERWLTSLAGRPDAGHAAESGGWMGAMLNRLGRRTYRHARLILWITAVISLVAVYGISRITINDNPTKWFTAGHPIRIADRILNQHFGGTYMAYLRLAPAEQNGPAPTPGPAPSRPTTGDEPQLPAGLVGDMDDAADAAPPLPAGLNGSAPAEDSGPALPPGLGGTPAPSSAPAAPAARPVETPRPEIFKDPAVLRYIADLQTHLLTITDRRGRRLVGKSNSLADLVKTVHRELLSGKPDDFRIPDSAPAVAQCLMQFQNSHRPQDLWHFVTPDYRQTNLWLQLRSGDNRDMNRVVDAVNRYVEQHPLPAGLTPRWFGLTYINVIWQDQMVSGMLEAFLGSFLVVLLMMILLFRSALWGLLSMIPLTVTVGLIYGLIGLVGKDYDMPVAVLSSLSLGLAVDYAIHFLARSRSAREKDGRWADAVGPMFGEPAQAITRNAIVVGVGFLPLLAAPLMPYRTVGLFIAMILLTAGAASLLILPALITVLERWLFPVTAGRKLTCRCGTCLVSAIAAVALVAVNVHQFFNVGWNSLSGLSCAAVVVLAGGCWLSSRRRTCGVPAESPTDRSPSKGTQP